MRVLFIVPSPYWITAEEARQIMKHNPRIEGMLCSVSIVDELLERDPALIKKIDLVHFMVPVAGRVHLAKFKGKIPCVATIHHIEPGYAPEAVAINAQADSIMVVSEMWRSELIARGVPADRMILLPNGVDTNLFRPPSISERSQLRQSMGFDPEDIVIGFSGTPGRDRGWRKGLDVFIDALARLKEQDQRVAVVVGGPGWDAAIQQINRLGIKTYRRPYVLNVEDAAPMYRALDFFWVTSRIEGGPVPLMEAMSSGVCCISTKVGIAPEVIQDGITGRLAEIEDSRRIAEITKDLIEHAEARLALGVAARRRIIAGYDWAQTAKQASVLYETASKHFIQQYPAADHQRRAVDPLLSPNTARWLAEQEQLGWARELCRMGERRAALRIGWRAALLNPFSIRTWSFVANLIPLRELYLGRFLKMP